MKQFGRFVVKYRVLILIVAVLLLIPSVIGMVGTRINYDMLDYLPTDMDTVAGQNILMDDFGKGAFSILVVEDMQPRQVADLKAKIAEVPHVDTVVWYDSILDLSVPMEVLPAKYYDAFNRGDATLMAVFFDTSTSADETIGAITDIRNLCDKQCYVTGMSAMVTDLKELCEHEEPIYVLLAVALACFVMTLLMDSWLVAPVFLASIGISILYNMGTNFFLGEISYLTKALSAVLQLAVTMDYSIFLWHSYSEQKKRFDGDRERAMTHAIANTLTSVTGSSITTIAGFIALCFMSFTLGRDLGIVMAKGVFLGVIGCLTILPAMLLVFERGIEKTRHKALLPSMDKLAAIITRRPAIFAALFLVILVPALYGYTNTQEYYDIGATMPEDMAFVVANTKLKDDFDMASTHMILADKNLSAKDAKAMLAEMEQVDGVKLAAGFDSLVGSAVPAEIIPDSISNILTGDKYQLMLISSHYQTASDEVNAQITELNAILKKYDKGGMLIGEAPCTKDLIQVTSHDFTVVSIISIAAIFLIILVVLQSFSLPLILVAVIEFAIFINLGIPFYTNVTLPFVAPICISTIQLGATVDYAILMTTRYKKERRNGGDKHYAVTTALSASISSILVSALGFFAATFGVGLYSDIDVIRSMCMLMARGAVISMFSVIFILPALLYLLDSVICKSTRGCKPLKSTLSTITSGKDEAI